MHSQFRPRANSCQQQRGAALVVGLLLLLVLTLLGLSSSNVSIMQERMAGNVQDRNLAFQRAEEVIRDYESRVAALAGGGAGNLGTIPLWGGLDLDVGDCALLKALNSGVWGENGWDSVGWTNVVSGSSNQQVAVIDLGLGGDDYQTSGCIPMMEIGSTPMGQYYMILARARGQTDASEVILQSIYYKP